MSIRIPRLGFYDKETWLSFLAFFDLSNDWELDMDLLRFLRFVARLGWAGLDRAIDIDGEIDS